MVWLNVSHKVFLALPLRFTASNTTNYSLKLALCAAWMYERGEWRNREDWIKAFSERLYLNFNCLVESVVKNEVYVVLCVLKSYLTVRSSRDQLNVAIARRRKGKEEVAVLYFVSTVRECQTGELFVSKFWTQVLCGALLLYVSGFVSNHLEFSKRGVYGGI